MDVANRPNSAKKWLKRALWWLCALVLYLASTVPVGLMLYAAKEKLGWDIFKRTGFHHYIACLDSEAKIAVGEPRPANTPWDPSSSLPAPAR
ncbi:MAG TPA: hypothetical protein VHP58_02535 [Alphaproteobacteria bacterium]|nr:hypothetical protein [Alphaproteobacteria bacterium]